MSTVPQFYVYVLARPNGKPFYVGKGRGKRVFRHEQEAKSGHRCQKCNIIRKIWRQGGEVQRYVVFTTDNEQEALDYEVALIEMYGKHTLANVTDGGTGVSGYEFTPEVKAKISRANKGRKPTPEANANVSKGLLGHPVSEETKAKLRAAALRRAQTPEGRAHLRAASEKAKSPGARAKADLAVQQRANDPKWRAEHSERIKRYFQTEEGRRKHSEGQRRRYSDPTQREQARIIAQERVRRQREQTDE